MPDDKVGRFNKFKAEAKDVFDETGFARREEGSLTRFQKFLHFWVLAGKSFVRNRCPVRASALAYASLLAMVPMLAVVISVSSSLLKRQGEEPIQQFIEKMVSNVTPEASPVYLAPGDPAADAQGAQVADSGPGTDPKTATTGKMVAHRINEFVGNIRSGTLGATGMVGLLFVAIAMLSRIENTFNDIWGVTRGRSWVARVFQYWAAITLGPILLMVVLALTSGPHFQAIRDYVQGLGQIGQWLTRLVIALLPFGILSLAFGLFYQLMPNTRVEWPAAMIGGLVGGCLWQLNNQFSVLYVAQVVKNSKIYGSLGMVPVFMIGLYISWIILLFGSQVAYAFQNRRTYFQERQAEGVHQRSREFIALRLMAQIASRFERGERPPSLTELAESLAVPPRLTGRILQTLVSMKLLVEVSDEETAYAPARPLPQISAQDILQAMRVGGGMDMATTDDATRGFLRAEFERISKAESDVATGITLQEMVRHPVL